MRNISPDTTKERGFTILVAILVAGLVLAIGLTILNVTLKHTELAGLAKQSEEAFYAADAGIECALFWDRPTPGPDAFVQGSSQKITCMNVTQNISGNTWGNTQSYTFNQSSDKLCTIIHVTKFHSNSGPVGMGSFNGSCPSGVTCTVIQSDGYNTTCNKKDTEGPVERELTVRY